MATINLSDYNKNKVPDASSFSFGIVVSNWNSEITEKLYEGAVKTLMENGATKENIIRWDVPGSFELIFGSRQMIETQEIDAVISIGCVIQGETKHFDYVCQAVTHGIKDLNLEYDVPVIYCVLTDDNLEQSRARSGGKLGNKGVDCAVAAIKMANLQEKAEGDFFI
jgi:6,7-dimethyl-8-ribityllumazine synthase